MNEESTRPDVNAGNGGQKPTVPMCEIKYDTQDMRKADVVTITFNLENVSKMAGGIGLDFLLGRMERIKNDLEMIVWNKQQERAKLMNPEGSLKIVQ